VASCQVVGYPAMIKASWGGGGKGIRKVGFIFYSE
jgi:acetyl/propionyl-CoA carboxylase alpha subunit